MANDSGPASAGNVLAAVCSFFIPGLGQLVQGRPVTGLIHFRARGRALVVFLGWVVHLWSVYDAAVYRR